MKTIVLEHELDFVGSLFGIVINKIDGRDIIGLYIEDDGCYFLKAEFHSFWLQDLIKVAQLTQENTKEALEEEMKTWNK